MWKKYVLLYGRHVYSHKKKEYKINRGSFGTSRVLLCFNYSVLIMHNFSINHPASINKLLPAVIAAHQIY